MPADEVAARERLRDVVDGALHEALDAWSDACDQAKLGAEQFDDFYLEVFWHIDELTGLLSMGRPDRQMDLEDLASGEIVPVLMSAGTPS